MVTHRSILLLSLVLGPACLTIDENDLVKRQEEVQDGDGDGYVDVELGGDDCDDGDPAVNPGAQEVWYDGVDSDCDGADDSDADGDGFASDEYGGDDCDDGDETIRP
ncbi:MAG: MopE-related protein, partial [Myxococcota bacterium]|nr:MopE-related protein [Myxococcota bacterium]